MNHEELESKSLEEIRAIALKCNIKVHHKHSKEKLIYQITQQPKAFQDDAMKHSAEKNKPPVDTNSQDDVIEMAKKYKYLEKEGFDLQFPGDGTWIAKYRGAEDSGTINMPMRMIQMKLQSVSRGALRPAGFSRDEGFDTTVGKGYANNVLVGGR